MKKALWLVLILLLIGFCWWGYKKYKGNHYNSNYSSQTSQLIDDTSYDNSGLIGLLNKNYKATVNSVAANSGADSTAVIEYNATTNRSMVTIMSNGQTSELIYDGSNSYFRVGDNDTWIMGSNSNEQTNSFYFVPENLQRSVDYLTNADNEGQAACGSETCTVYSYDEGARISKVFLNSAGVLKKIEYYENNNLSADIDFEYDIDANIEIPTNVLDTSNPEALTDPDTLNALKSLGN